MSRSSFRKPEFRLYLNYPDVVLTRMDRSEPIGAIRLDTPGFGSELRRFTAEVAREGGRLTVVLPESEVWRGRIDLTGHPRSARHDAARALIAARLGVPPAAVYVVVGKSASAGAAPVAGVRSLTLAQTRELFDGMALDPAAIIGAGAFAGFATPPRLDERRWRLPLPAAPLRPAVALGGALAAAAVAGILAWPSQPPTPPLDEEVAVLQPPAPPPARVPAAAPIVHAAQPPRSLALLHARQPVARPKSVPALGEAPMVTRATRNVVLIEPRPGATPELELAELTPARATMIDAVMQPPLRRPTAAASQLPAPNGAPPLADTRPMRRPTAAASPALPPTPVTAGTAAAGSRPLPRPAARGAQVVASLDPASPPAASLATPPSLPPLARPAPVAARPAAKKPAPPVVRGPSSAPVPQSPPRQATPAPVRQKVVVARAPVATPKPAAPSLTLASAATQKVGLSRNSVSLIGVFGGEDGRHALLRLPNGSVQRVSAGDSVQGVQVAAVGTDSVRLSGRGRDTLLLLPD